MKAFLYRVSKAEPDELAAALWAFAYFFALLASYYVLRPIRDEMSMQVGPRALSTLFSAVFVVMVALVPLFGWLTRRFTRRRLLPGLYAFFASNLLGFFAVMQASGNQTAWVARVFYVWVSVFNLFVVSVFWSFMADIFETQQARRLYGFIAAGGTAGALVGPLITAAFVTLIGPKPLMLVSASFLLLALLSIARLSNFRSRASASVATSASSLGSTLKGSLWSGLADLVRSRYLLAICGFLFSYALLSTFLYFQTAELLPREIKDSAARTALLARFDLAVNVLTLLLQVFAFRALMARLGTRFVLAALPCVSLLGGLVFAFYPVVSVVLGLGLLRRSGEYALSKPARETLFNPLPAAQKYRAKNVIDTLVHRSGDAVSAWAFHGLISVGFDTAQIAWLSVPIAAAWLAIALWLGQTAERRAGQAVSAPP